MSENISVFHDVIEEILSQMYLEDAKAFFEEFKKKLNEQTNLQKNSGASR